MRVLRRASGDALGQGVAARRSPSRPSLLCQRAGASAGAESVGLPDRRQPEQRSDHLTRQVEDRREQAVHLPDQREGGLCGGRASAPSTARSRSRSRKQPARPALMWNRPVSSGASRACPPSAQPNVEARRGVPAPDAQRGRRYDSAPFSAQLRHRPGPSSSSGIDHCSREPSTEWYGPVASPSSGWGSTARHGSGCPSRREDRIAADLDQAGDRRVPICLSSSSSRGSWSRPSLSTRSAR